MNYKISLIAVSFFAGLGIYALIRDMAINCIGELKYMRREAEKRKGIIEASYKKKNAEYLTQIHLEEYVQILKAEDECIQQLEEKIKNHWGWKILNPQKEYVSRFDFL